MTKTLHSNIWALGLLLIASATVFAACGGGSEPEDVQFDLAIEDGEIELGPSVMKVKQGDDVTISIDSDKMGSFHLHGYDIETDIGPSNTTTMSFTANATGSFQITFHGASHGGESSGEMDLVTHGALFESKTLLEGDRFSLDITHELAGKTVVFHNHMDHEETGMIMVSENGAESGAVRVRLLDDGSFEPSDISVRPGATIVWTNASPARGRVVSGPPPGGDHADGHDAGADDAEEDGHQEESGHEGEEADGDHEDEQGGEEVTLGSLEVHPR